MIKNEKEYYEAFHDSVSKILGPIADKYSLQVKKEDDNTFKIPLNGFELSVSLGFGHLPDVNMSIIQTKCSQDNDYEEAIGIVHLKNCAEHIDEKVDLRLKHPSDTFEKIKFLADILINHGAPFLKGDFSQWDNLVICVNKKIKKRLSQLNL
jgi:hypothetical protein